MAWSAAWTSPRGTPGPCGTPPGGVPVEAVDGVVPLRPERCHHCQPPVPGEAPQPPRPQVTESPPVTPVVTAYQWHRWGCPVCGAAPRAAWPPGIPTGGCGPRVQALTALCTGADHRAKRAPPNALEDLCGVVMGWGTVANLEQGTVEALAEPVAEARTSGQAQPTAPLDETGGREGQERAGLWPVVTAWGTGFVGRLSRRSTVVQDRWGARFWGGW